MSSDERAKKAYIVESVGYGVKECLVYANTVKEANEIVARGDDYEVLDTHFKWSRDRRAYRTPEDDYE